MPRPMQRPAVQPQPDQKQHAVRKQPAGRQQQQQKLPGTQKIFVNQQPGLRFPTDNKMVQRFENLSFQHQPSDCEILFRKMAQSPSRSVQPGVPTAQGQNRQLGGTSIQVQPSLVKIQNPNMPQFATNQSIQVFY